MTRTVVVIIGVCLLTFFAGLGAPAISDSDEAFYAESAREMVESSDWLTPHFNYTFRFEKPVLYYWLVATAYVAVGVGEGAARLPSALAGLGLALVTFAAARRCYDGPTGKLAGLITATSFGYVAMARQALPDLTLAFFVTLTTWAALRVSVAEPFNGGQPLAGRMRFAWVVLVGLGAAGGMLTKGPVGLILPAIVVFPIWGWERWSGRFRGRISWFDLAIASAVFLVLAAPWYVGMTLEHGTAYLDRFFLAENVERFTTARYNDPRPFWYYVPIVVLGLLPWAPHLWLSGAAALRRVRYRLGGGTVGVWLSWWAAAPFLFYTFSIGQQPRYVLPLLPPLAMLLARALRREIDSAEPSRALAICTSMSGLTLCLLGLFLYRAGTLLLEWDRVWIVGASGALLVSGLAVVASVRRPRWTVAATVAASIVASLTVHTLLLSSPHDAPVERIARMLKDARVEGEMYGRYNVLHRNLIFYTGVPFQELPSQDAAVDFMRSARRVLVALPAEDIHRLEAGGATVHRLGEVRYFDVGSLSLRVLVDPDPKRDVRRIVLVANR